uniref:Uncharacterized protein n=1 Tax=Glossina palpalis gambiensis TaxID=67801 RepID=A0A1B0C7M3_9MUSC
MKSVMSSYEMRSSASAHTQRYATAATTTDNDVTKHTLKDVENTRSAFMQTPICANVLKISSLTNSKVLKADFLLYLQQFNILACTFPTENTKIWPRFSKRLCSRKISCQWNQCE